MNNIVSNKIPNIFSFLLQVKSIEECIRYFNENISRENKEKIKRKNFKFNTIKFLNISVPFFESKPATVLGNLNLPNFNIEFEKTLSQELKKVPIRDLIHKKMFDLTEKNIIDLFRLFVLPLFIKCFLPLTYSKDSYSLLYIPTELIKYMNIWKKIIDYEPILIPVGLKHIANLIIENDKNKFSESDICIIKKFKEYLIELKNKDCSNLYVYFQFVANIEVNFLYKDISKIIENIIKDPPYRPIRRGVQVDYMRIIQFFFILFLIDNFELFNSLRELFINIQKECNSDKLYILYYKLKYIEEQTHLLNTNAISFYTSVYDYLVYKLYLDIQEIVEPRILYIIEHFELKYTFIDELIEKQIQRQRQVEENNKRRTLHQLEQKPVLSKKPNNQNLSQENNNDTIDINFDRISLNDTLNILNRKLEKIKKTMIEKNIHKLNNKMSSKLQYIDYMYSLLVLLKNEYQNEYKDKDKLLKKIRLQLKEHYPSLRNNNINSVNKISDFFKLFNNPRMNTLKLQKVFNYLIDVLNITNEDIIQSIQSNNPSHNEPPPQYSNINGHNILGYRQITS
jgi:hypothetical protein